MAHSTFAERLGYAILLRHLETGAAPSYAEIGRAVERTGQWVTKWADSDEPPTDYRVHAPMAKFLGVEERWLFRDEGDAPQPELWETWIAQRRRRGAKVSEGGVPAKKSPGAGRKHA